MLGYKYVNQLTLIQNPMKLTAASTKNITDQKKDLFNKSSPVFENV